MNAKLNAKEKSLTLRVPGDLLSTNAATLRGEIADLLDFPAGEPPTWRILRLDLTAAKMIDSVGLNLIVSLLKAVQKVGAKMQVAYSNQNVFRTFLFTRLDQHIELVKI
jgi:anti-anti-sigma factor